MRLVPGESSLKTNRISIVDFDHAIAEGEPAMPADVLRPFVFARHAESVANAANMLNSNPYQPVALTARGRTQARTLGA
jgi:hypothetical protein